MAVADIFINKGLKDAGCEFFVIDDGWQIDLSPEVNIIVNTGKFPSGIKALTAYFIQVNYFQQVFYPIKVRYLNHIAY